MHSSAIYIIISTVKTRAFLDYHAIGLGMSFYYVTVSKGTFLQEWISEGKYINHYIIRKRNAYEGKN